MKFKNTILTLLLTLIICINNYAQKIVVCELNDGQFAKVLRINFSGFEFLQFNKIQGLPFGNNELIDEFKKLVK